MELNNARQLIQLIDTMLYMMDKKGRKRFLLWVKQKRREYDFTHPLGGSHAKGSSADVDSSCVGTDNSEPPNTAEPSPKIAEVVSDSAGVKS